jgi:hypothetical protein
VTCGKEEEPSLLSSSFSSECFFSLFVGVVDDGGSCDLFSAVSTPLSLDPAMANRMEWVVV